MDMTTNIQYYSKPIPNVDEWVLVKFDILNQQSGYFTGKLIEYNKEAILFLTDATCRDKIKSWNKIVKLNKEMLACVYSIENDKVKLYLKQSNVPNVDIELKENRMFYNFMKSFSFVNNIDFSILWHNIGHYVDRTRENISMWTYFVNNYESIKNMIEPELQSKFDEFYVSKMKKTKEKISIELIIVSINGVTNTINMLNEMKSQLEFDIVYISHSKYKITFNNDECQEKFMQLFNELKNKYNIQFK